MEATPGSWATSPGLLQNDQKSSKTFLPHSKVIEYALTFVCLYVIMSLRGTWNTITIFIFMKSKMAITSLICTIVYLILFASCTLPIFFNCTFIANTFFKTIIKWFILFTEYALIFKFYSSRKAFTSFNISSIYKYFIFSTWSWIVNTNSIFDIILISRTNFWAEYHPFVESTMSCSKNIDFPNWTKNMNL